MDILALLADPTAWDALITLIVLETAFSGRALIPIAGE